MNKTLILYIQVNNRMAFIFSFAKGPRIKYYERFICHLLNYNVNLSMYVYK